MLLTLYIKTLDGRTTTCIAKHDSTLEYVKQELAAVGLAWRARGRFMHKGKILVDFQRTLQEYAIGEGSTLHLVQVQHHISNVSVL